MIDLEEVVDLAQQLIRISSTNPNLGGGNGTGEEGVAKFVGRWLKKKGFQVQFVPEKENGNRPSVIGIAKGKGGGKSLLFNGHLDTVSVEDYNGDPFSAWISTDGQELHGRGAADMKGGLAAAMVAAANAASERTLRGDIIVAAVADEEDSSLGSLAILERGLHADAAIFPEPTNEAVVTCHRGFTWLEVSCHGTSAHGSRYDLGRDAICDMGLFLYKLRQYDRHLAQRSSTSILGRGSVHAGTIMGGVETSTYPATCSMTIERRTMPGEKAEDILAEVQAIIDETKQEEPDVHLQAKILLTRPPLTEKKSSGQSFADLIVEHARSYLDDKTEKSGGPFWTDAALFSCPSVVFGPIGKGIHEETEWVNIPSLRRICQAYHSIIMDFCI